MDGWMERLLIDNDNITVHGPQPQPLSRPMAGRQALRGPIDSPLLLLLSSRIYLAPPLRHACQLALLAPSLSPFLRLPVPPSSSRQNSAPSSATPTASLPDWSADAACADVRVVVVLLVVVLVSWWP